MRLRAVIVAGMWLFSRAAAAQRAPALVMPAANARHPEEFSAIVGIRELSDGRVLVSDSREKRIVVLDFATGKSTPIGRIGDGPKEYRQVSALYALPRDSTLMPLDWGGNWFIMSGDVAAGRLLSDQALGSTRYAMVGGFDAGGTALLLTQVGPSKANLGEDSLEVVLHDRRTHEERRIGRARSPYGAPPGAPRVSGRQNSGAVRAFDPRSPGPGPATLFEMDRVAMFPDGWVAIARLQPYRVDWRAADGTVTNGAPIEPPRAYSDRDKQAHLDEQAALSGSPRRKVENVFGWPDYLPAFEGQGFPLLTAPDGRLWIARKVTADAHGHRYDVVNRKGQLVGVMALPANQRLVGFGRRAAYVAVTDDDGIQRLQRHPTP